jgi:hypothetical protein
LERLYLANELTSDIKEELNQVVFGGKKKPTKKELEKLKDLLLAHYQTKTDRKADKERKENQIKEFLGL